MRAILTYVIDPKTGEREIHIDYEGDLGDTPDEHEVAHAKAVAALLGRSVSALRADGIEVVRASESDAPDASTAAEAEPLVQQQHEVNTD